MVDKPFKTLDESLANGVELGALRPSRSPPLEDRGSQLMGLTKAWGRRLGKPTGL